MISIIVATDKNCIISKNGKIPWHNKDDFKHFKETTMGCPLIMGRKTFESLPKLLPGRPHIVISRQKSLPNKEIVLANNMSEACCVAKRKISSKNEIFIIGGEEIYNLALTETFVDKIYLSIIDIEIESDPTCKYFIFERKQYSKIFNEKNNGFTLEIYKKL